MMDMGKWPLKNVTSDVEITCLILTRDNHEATIHSGSYVRVYGSGGADILHIESGARVECFHMVGESKIYIDENSDGFKILRSGATVIFTNPDTGTFLKLPAGLETRKIIFNDIEKPLDIKDDKVVLDKRQIDLTVPVPGSLKTWYQDADGDGYGPANWNNCEISDINTEAIGIVTKTSAIFKIPIIEDSSYTWHKEDSGVNIIEFGCKIGTDEKYSYDFGVDSLTKEEDGVYEPQEGTIRELFSTSVDSWVGEGICDEHDDACFSDEGFYYTHASVTEAKISIRYSEPYIVIEITDPFTLELLFQHSPSICPYEIYGFKASQPQGHIKIQYRETLPDDFETGDTFTNKFGMTFVKIPAGSFMMGSADDDPDASDDEKPRHRVTFAKNFYMQTTEVTQGQWKAVMGNNPSWFQGEHAPTGVNTDNLPVEQVSWDDVQEFIAKLNESTDGKYKLPSEAQWEYAARGGVENQKYSGSDDVDEVAWYSENSGYMLHEVGKKKPNGWGLYDMSGNLWEWCQDHWHRNYDGAPADGSAWVKSADSDWYRVLRGGSWSMGTSYQRPTNCNYSSSINSSYRIGFRLVKQP